jgi:microcystin-dependent protein
MSSPFLGEIRIFATNFAPIGWILCNGQILPISQYTALFSLLGTTYGGDGRSNFGLPNLQGLAPLHPGQGPGLSLYDLGETGGAANVTLLSTQVPPHTHTYTAGAGGKGEVAAVTGNVNSDAVALTNIYGTTSDGTQMSPGMLQPAGSGTPHNNMQPYLTLNFCIAMTGIFPSRG